MSHEVESAKDFSIWVGGFFYWLKGGCKEELKNQYADESEMKNFWAGSVILMLLILSALFLFIYAVTA
ncbi:MAG: hypothetical protein QM791_20675 [Ferruginibacter sp.]